MKYGLVCILIGIFTAVAAGRERPELWMYQSTNLLTEKNVVELEALWRRAAAAGYTHVQLNDSKFARLDEMPKKYFDHAARVKKLGDELKLQMVPGVFPIGWSNDLLSHNPNLAEGQLVEDALFVVQGGEAKPVANPAVAMPKKPDFVDPTVKLESNLATVNATAEHSRFMYSMTVAPKRVYHLSAWVKTDGFTGEPKIQVLAGKPARPLHYNELGVKRTQEWTQYHVIFNSQNETKASIYFGVWGKAGGSLQWRDWQIEDAGLVNVLRRPGTPVTVKGYVEGKDYERIEDPKLGRKQWAGEYEVWHTPPTIKTKLPDGTQLRVSWYHPAVIYGGSVCICLSEPETQTLLADNAERVSDLFGSAGMMMNHDEIRIANTCMACKDRKLDAGPLLSDNIAFCTDLLKGKQAYAWSDMFDPHHNAKNNYYLVSGDLTNSWQGLRKDVTVLNWNFGKRDDSLKFFADRGHKQIIAGYYDSPVEKVREWMKSASRVPGVAGYMYTTWEHNYADLEAFAKIVHP